MNVVLAADPLAQHADVFGPQGRVLPRRVPFQRAYYVVYALLLCLLLSTLALGQIGSGVARLYFVAGSVAIAAQAFRAGGLALHVQIVIPLFVFAPLLRRFVDLHVGYDVNGTMLVAPLFALTVVFSELRGILVGRPSVRHHLFPYVLILICLSYGWAIAAFQGDFVTGSVLAAKYAIPLLYCICLILRPDQSSVVLQAAANAFLVVSPMIGLYGILQHLDPQPWDRLWMISSKMASIGLPAPGQVRVFSTMNSPVSFAAYATCGLLLFSFTRRSFMPPILILPLAILPLSLALLLSAVRASWISAALSLAVCIGFKKTRGRAVVIIACLGCGIAIALLFTSFGDTVAGRLSTLSGNVANDGSGNERIEDYLHVFAGDSRYLFGVGFGNWYDRQLNALDGLLLSSAVQMGTVLGVIHTFGVLWAGTQAAACVRRDSDTMRLVASALVVGDLAIFVLTSISVGEIGFLFWMLIGVLTSGAGTTKNQFRPTR